MAIVPTIISDEKCEKLIAHNKLMEAAIETEDKQALLAVASNAESINYQAFLEQQLKLTESCINKADSWIEEAHNLSYDDFYPRRRPIRMPFYI